MSVFLITLLSFCFNNLAICGKEVFFKILVSNLISKTSLLKRQTIAEKYVLMTNHINFSATRQRLTGEIEPINAEQSSTAEGNEALYGAGKAIDLDILTGSWALPPTPGSDIQLWWKANFGKVHCIHRVIWYAFNGVIFHSWTCTNIDCNACFKGSGTDCSRFTITVLTEGAGDGSQQSDVSDCKYGDRVRMDFENRFSLHMREIAFVGKRGEGQIIVHVCPQNDSYILTSRSKGLISNILKSELGITFLKSGIQIIQLIVRRWSQTSWWTVL